MTFQVGDRVRRISSNAGEIHTGTEWIVSYVAPSGRHIKVQDDPMAGSFRKVEYFELVEQEVTQPEAPQRVHTCYLIVYEFRDGVNSMRRTDEALANREVERIVRDGGTVHAKKKITVRY